METTMSDKTYRRLTIAVTLGLIMGFWIPLTRSSSAQKEKPGRQEPHQLALLPKAQLPREDGRWPFAPDVPPPFTRNDQRREVVHWTIREAQNEVAPGVIYDDAWGFEGRVPGPLLRVRVGDLVEVHLRNALNSNPQSQH
jgi:FtsP/CotA-like multicopper oxidase with cupredoxin domain